jgi:hypothetical protein
MREALDRVRVVLAFLILCLFSLLVGYRFRYHGKKPPVIELVIVAPMAGSPAASPSKPGNGSTGSGWTSPYPSPRP